MIDNKIPVVINGTGEVVYLPDDTIVTWEQATVTLLDVHRTFRASRASDLTLPDRRVGRVEGYEDEIERLHKERDALVVRLETEAMLGRMGDADLAEAIDGLDRLDVYAYAMRKAIRIVRGEP